MNTRVLFFSDSALAPYTDNEIIIAAYEDRLSALKGISAEKAEAVKKDLIEAGIIPNETIRSKRARYLYKDIIGLKMSDFYRDYGFKESYSDERVEELREILAQILDDRKCFVIEEHYGLVDGDRKSFQEIAMTLGISRSRVKQLVLNGLRKLFKNVNTIDEEWYRKSL